MKISEVLANEAMRRDEFPVCREQIFLAHAGDCPLPRRVGEAISEYARLSSTGDQEKFVYPEQLAEARRLAAGMLKCRSEEISLAGPTSLALSLIASGLKLRRGENILIYFDDYPSNVYPWMALAEKGVEVRLMNTRGLGVIRPRDVIGQIDENTRLVALASCHFISGYRLEVDAIGKALRDRGILFCLDAIQTLGAFPTTTQHVDFLAADAHKWLLGPCGAGLLYVRDGLQDRLNPPIYGWHNVECPGYVAQERIAFRRGPQKYEPGTHNLLGVVGLVAALRLISDTGVDQIAQELLRKRAWLVPALQEKGCVVAQADAPPENASGIISFHHPQRDMQELHRKLEEKQIITSLRVDRQGRQYTRLSPHFYNTDSELQRVVDAI